MPARTTRRTWTSENGADRRLRDSGTAKNEANGGIDGCSDGGVSVERGLVLDLPVDLQELGVGQLPRRARRAPTGGAASAASGRRRGCRSGASVGPTLSKAGMTSRPNVRRLSRTCSWGIVLVGVEDEVDEVDAGRLPLLQLADDLLGVADGDALRRLAGVGRAGGRAAGGGQQPGRRVALRRPRLLGHVELAGEVLERADHACRRSRRRSPSPRGRTGSWPTPAGR